MNRFFWLFEYVFKKPIAKKNSFKFIVYDSILSCVERMLNNSFAHNRFKSFNRSALTTLNQIIFSTKNIGWKQIISRLICHLSSFFFLALSSIFYRWRNWKEKSSLFVLYLMATYYLHFDYHVFFLNVFLCQLPHYIVQRR